MPEIKQRKIDESIQQQLVDSGLDPILARIVASRPIPEAGVDASLNPKLKLLDNPALMQDMDIAVARLVKAIQDEEVIGVETDHDCDGQTSHAVIYLALTNIFGVKPNLVQSYIGHRMKEGYGLSDSVADRILADDPKPTLVITADNGSADEPRIARLKEAGIEVIVTDHHHLPEEGPPKSALATLNPTREDCSFPDPYIAGCMVAWLLMAATRAELVKQKLIPPDAPPLKTLLDYVAVGTVADCVSMARSVNNRAVVQYGLRKIMQMTRPCWQALVPILNKPTLKSEDLGFTIGPMLNSDGRLSDAFGSVSFLLATDLEEAEPWARQLTQQNEARKTIQKRITDEAMKLASEQVASDKVSIAVYLEDGHAGVHGISASRLKDHFGRPVIIFSPKEGEDEIISGSARSIDNLNIRDAIALANETNPGCVEKFGGHTGAAGLTILKSKLSEFTQAFEDAVLKQVSLDEVGPVVYSDGILPANYFSLNFVDELGKLDPFGREFESPVFESEATIVNIKPVGQTGVHLSLTIKLENNQTHRAIWFSADDAGFKLNPGDNVHLAFSISDNIFRDNRQLQLMVKGMFP